MDIDLMLSDSKPVLKDGQQYFALVFEALVTPDQLKVLSEKASVWVIKARVD